MITLNCGLKCYTSRALCNIYGVCVSASADILDRVSPKLHRLGLTYECLGGGRIDYNSSENTIKIYGYSVVSIV